MSGIDFLEDFAGSSLWPTAPAKRRFQYLKEPNTGMIESHRLALTMNGVVDRSLDDAKGLQSSDFEGYQIFEEGDLAFKLIDLENIKTSRVGLVPRRGIMSPAYIRLRAIDPRRSYAPFYFWYFYAAYRGNIFNGLGGGIRQNLSQTELLEFPIPEMAYEDQKKISDYLDGEVKRIDLLIERKNDFLRLLAEKRDAVISQVATKGLHADVAMQPTELASIGTVPAHWQLNPIGRALQVTKRIVGDRHDHFSLLSLTTRGVIARDVSQNFGKFPESFDSYQIVEPGNFVFCLFDMDETPRTVGLSENAGIITGAYAVFECTEPAYSRYLLNLFLHLDNCKGLKPFYTGLRKTIRPPRFTSIRIPFPPEDEAREIAEHIERQCSKLDRLVERTRRSIELLREHRTALITAAVTGKIDVRNAA